MKTKVLVIFSGIFLITLLTAGYTITHKAESTFSITGHTTENSISYIDNFQLTDIDASLNAVTILNNISIVTPNTQNFTFVFFTKSVNEDESCNSEGDLTFTPLLYTKKSVCIDFCVVGYNSIMGIVEEYKPILNNSQITIENILESKVIIKAEIKKNSCDSEVNIRSELTPIN